MAALTLTSTVKLPGNVEMPVLGLGVWQCPGTMARRAVLAALAAGYRHIDTAAIYGNEAEVGAALREAGVSRQDVFITTKLWTVDHGRDLTLKAFEASLQRLGLEQVDQYLSHYPVPGQRLDAWKTMIDIQRSGRCRSIGVSNYTVRHLQELIDRTGVVPAVNQVEFHPFLFQRELLEFCTRHGIRVVAYSPLTHGKRLSDPRLTELAEQYERTPAQMLIRWGLQHGLVVIPKSSHADRIVENAAVFDFQINSRDLQLMDAWHENLRTCWDPSEEP